MTKEQETIHKLNKKSTWLRILAVMLVILAFALFIYLTSTQDSKIEVQTIEIAQRDSILNSYTDSTKKTTGRSDSLLMVVARYLTWRNDHKADSLEQLYADTVINYFKNLQHVHRSVITKNDKTYWKHFTSDKYIVTDKIKILMDAGGDKAFVKGKECRDESNCLEELIEIHFTNEMKINYVRAFFSK